ncbi:phosphoribosyltransferase [Rhizobium sp. KVB221]|uniref:Phosphoribosyltransferase n=1 Tax=Rhizobium setariae TaxID=2801340 RepID=A0A936YSA0_9HYPH|nr:phosphoribosyltransferase family protein [Rhizobium setariae]MBL0373877.1 phosphoribosyltransferase [Rhizobium setariae]
MSFLDRSDAGNRLAEKLAKYRHDDVIILALPRGGVEVALPIALKLSAPLDLLVVRKLGVPGQPELAMGAVIDGDTPTIVRNEDVLRLLRISKETFERVVVRELAEIERRRRFYCGERSSLPVQGKVAVVVDDGIATGATLRAALARLKTAKPSRIVVAVPVAPKSVVEDLKLDVDEFVCLEALGRMGAINLHYHNFAQLSDAEVIEMLDAARTIE